MDETITYWDFTQERYVTWIGDEPRRISRSERRGKGRFQSTGNSDKRRKQRARLIQRDELACHWCGVTLSLTLRTTLRDRPGVICYPTIDHVIELSRGGSRRDENCVLSCQPCNGRRSNPRGVIRFSHELDEDHMIEYEGQFFSWHAGRWYRHAGARLLLVRDDDLIRAIVRSCDEEVACGEY